MTLEGLGKLMLGLQRMVEELPRYNLPEINENGDIIIRRIDPQRESRTAEAACITREGRRSVGREPLPAQQCAQRVKRLVGVAEDLEHRQDRDRHQRARNTP